MAATRRLTRSLARWPAAVAAAFAVAALATAPASGTRTTTVAAAASTSVDAAHALAIHADGSIVAAGTSQNDCERFCARWDGFAVARYLADGRLDRRFGRDGRALVELGDDFSVDGRVSAAARPGGSTVLAGGNVWSWFRLLRLTRAGRLDTRFGRGGVTEPFERERCAPAARALAIQADGKIVVAGECLDAEAEEWQEALLARYTADGRLDATFGEGGSVLTAFGELAARAYAVAIQPDGRIVVAGERDELLGRPSFIARYMPNGQLDASFGSGGTLAGGSGAAHVLALQRDGAIVVGGVASIARYLPNGHPDPSFGGGASVPTGFAKHYGVSGLAITADGRIVAAGRVRRGNHYDFAVRRYAPDGRPDATFGSGGVVLTDLRGRRRNDIASAVAVQRDGRIVVAGRSEPRNSEFPADFALARYTLGGRLDSRFGARGTVLTDFDARVSGFASFTATRRGAAVLVRWRTTAEDGSRGFHVYRDGDRVTRRLIASRGGPARGASYVFRDRGARARRAGYFYVLREIKRDGRTITRATAWVRR